MKNFKTTLVYLGIAALVGGYILLFERGPAKKKDEKDKKKVIADFVADDIRSIQIEALGTTLSAKPAPIDLQKDEKDAWHITAPKAYKADDATIRTALTGIGDFNPDTTIEDPKNLKDYGLDPPVARCTLKSKDGKTFVLLIGDKSMSGSSAYIKTGDGKAVYLVASFATDNLKKGLDNYRDRSFFKTDSVLAQRVEITREGKSYLFVKAKDNSWDILKPIRGKGDAGKIRDLLNAISSLHIEEFVTDHPTGLGAYGLSSPRVRIEVQDSDSPKPHTILMGKKKDKTTNVYAKSGEEPYLYLVGEYFDKTADIKISDYRDKSPMQFDGGAVKSLTVRRGTSNYVYEKDAKGQWACPGRSDANNEATVLINLLSGTTVLEFPTKTEAVGLKSPFYVLEVALADGKTRTFRYGKRDQGKVYLASDHGPEVYLVADGVMGQLDAFYNNLLTPVPAATSGAK